MVVRLLRFLILQRQETLLPLHFFEIGDASREQRVPPREEMFFGNQFEPRSEGVACKAYVSSWKGQWASGGRTGILEHGLQLLLRYVLVRPNLNRIRFNFNGGDHEENVVD